MGLSIHYSGSIRDYYSIAALTEEVKDVCEVMNWRYHIFDDDQIKGISFAPPKSEPVFLTFRPDGFLCSPILVPGDEDYTPFYYTIHAKTQYAGMDAHLAIIKLLRYLELKYFATLTVMDEGYFWETGDPALLQQEFDKYNYIVALVQESLHDFTAKAGETPEALAQRLDDFLKKKMGDQ